jgi:hypothetical protein
MRISYTVRASDIFLFLSYTAGCTPNDWIENAVSYAVDQRKAALTPDI